MNTFSITSTKTMAYNAAASTQAFAIIEKLVGVTGAILRAARRMGAASTAPVLRAAHS
jgi:hypothetical protein